MSESKPETEAAVGGDPELGAALQELRDVLGKRELATFILKTEEEVVVIIKTKKAVEQTMLAMHGIAFHRAIAGKEG